MAYSPATAGQYADKISEAAVRKSVNALIKWKKLRSKTTAKEADEDRDEDDFIYAVVTLRKPPPKHRSPASNPIKIPLPHPLRSFSDICLFVDDKPTLVHNSRTTLSSEAMQKKIKALGVPITRVLKLSKIKSKFKSFEAKRVLSKSHDLFLADKRVVRFLPGILGKQFYKNRKRVPVPVELEGDRNWKEEIDGACCSTLLCFGTGTCSAVKVGRVTMENGEIVDNVIAAIDRIASVVPKKWAGIRALHLKLLDSVALPIYDPISDSNA
ncbi:unnamed protein product [Cuscuta campestris]|uniref:Ribosomal protein L1 n=1 Tax=Cuscuta campestris TaxID=132261 RepID=A0A484K7Q5_9ASTE|nr:unnamed protein product [Cuscuta campestris]